MSPNKKGQEKVEAVQVSRPATYVVDYDLPSDFRRKRFYRAVQTYMRKHYRAETGWSTWSVVFTDSAEVAWEVYRQARGVGGVAHVYEARRLDDEESEE